jgi:FixJ family two-component response regulator
MLTEADLAKLTHRQREVLTALARQLSSDEVARLLDIAEATLKIDMAAFRMRFRHWPCPPCPPSPTNEQQDPPAST